MRYLPLLQLLALLLMLGWGFCIDVHILDLEVINIYFNENAFSVYVVVLLLLVIMFLSYLCYSWLL